jgi:predicted extracellular nuclease
VIKDNATGDVETSNAFDATRDGMDFYESLEAMRVQVNNAVAVGLTNRFGAVFVVGDNGANATVRSARGGVVISADDYNPERILLSDDLIQAQSKMPKLSVGDKFTAPVVGVVSYNDGYYQVLLTAAPQTTSGGLTKEVTNAAANDQLTIATFNVENLSPSDPATKFNTLATLIVTNLKAPDIIAVEEIQDNSGSKDDGVVDSSQTVGKLIAAIQSAGGPVYDYRLINPDNDQDGGQHGGNIRQGFLFNPARVNFADRPGGTSTAATAMSSIGGQVVLSFSPGRIDPQNAAWQGSRKPLVGKFVFNNQSVFVIANHFNSKGVDQPLFGRFQPPTLSSETQRLQQATVVHDFTKRILDTDPNANIVVLGDFNDWEFSRIITTLKGDLLDNLVDTLPKSERYSYVFEGNSQILDQVLVSHNLSQNAAPEYDIVHINAEFAVQSSDHDPSVARLRIK